MEEGEVFERRSRTSFFFMKMTERTIEFEVTMITPFLTSKDTSPSPQTSLKATRIESRRARVPSSIFENFLK